MQREIVGQQYFYPKVKEIVSEALKINDKGKVILILGQPGSGKSVFINQLYDGLKEKGVEYFTPIRAEFLRETDSPQEIYESFQQVKEEDKPKVLLLDSLDVLAYSRRKELQEWLFYIDKLKTIKGMTVVCASRSFEAEHLFPMNQQEWSDKISIELLPDEFINKVLIKLNYDYKSIPLKLRDFLKVPLHLKIAAEIIQNGGDLNKISNLQGLYAKLCELLDLSTEEMILLSELADLMIDRRTIYLSYPSINAQLLDNIKKMERPGSAGIIQVDSKNQRVSFSHQTLIDYFSAWKVIYENKTIIEFVLEHKQSLFIRPVLRHILSFLRLSSEKRLFEELANLFSDNYLGNEIGYISKPEPVRMHIKTAILANMASWGDPTNEEGKFLLRLFKEPENAQILAIQFFNSGPNPDWFNVLKEIYILPILNNRNESDIEYRMILSFLVRIAKDKPSEILDILELILNRGYSNTLDSFLFNVSDVLSRVELSSSLQQRFVSCLEQAINKGFFRWYHELKTLCVSIAKYSPEKGLKLYLDSVLEELNAKETKIVSSQGSLTESFDEVLPIIYEKLPYKTLWETTDFFEQILANSYLGEKKLRDHPDELLYSEHKQRFGLDAFYNWYKNKMIEYCSNLTEEARQLIKQLEKSKWETQRQLSILCKLRNVAHFKDDIFRYVELVLNSDLNDTQMYRQSELLKRAIECVFEVISPSERDKIIGSLLNFQFDDEIKVREWIWEQLNHIPKSYRDERINKRLEELKTKYNFHEYKYAPPIKTFGAHWAHPIITANQLRIKSPDELYMFLIENQNLNDRWDTERDIFYGGVNELAQEVADVFVDDLDKYKNTIEKLSKDLKNDIYIGWFFTKLSQKGLHSEKVIDWLIELINRLYKRETLQLGIIRSLSKEANNLSHSQFDRLKGILFHLSDANDPIEDKFIEYRKQGYSNNALAEGINSTRGELVKLVIQLLSKFKDNVLFDILDKLSRDKTISVRAALVEYLPYAIESIGWDKCFEFFTNAFEKGAEEYSESIPNFLQYVPNDKIDEIKGILSKMQDKKGGTLGQAYALIITIYYLRGIFAEDRLIEVLRDPMLPDRAKEESLNLLANQVRYEENVDKCLKIINNLIDEDTFKGNASILFMEARPEDLKKFSSIIKKIIDKPHIRGEALYYILEYLQKSLLLDPLEVFNLLESILSAAGEDFYNLRAYIPASHSRAPLNIINTILECYPEEESRALEALDKLIKLNWEGVNEYLYALDRL